MCFYFQLSTDAQTLENRFKRNFQDKGSFQAKTVINAFEHPHVPIILPKKVQFKFSEWGLIPIWAKDSLIQNLTLNARIETLDEKPSFKNYIQNRCLIPATGFYEWQWLDEKGKEKQCYLVNTAQEPIFAFAGITSNWVDKNTGEIKNTFTIITTQANVLMSEIHNTKKRMPVILNPKDEQDWLDGVNFKNFAYPYENNLNAIKI